MVTSFLIHQSSLARTYDTALCAGGFQRAKQGPDLGNPVIHLWHLTYWKPVLVRVVIRPLSCTGMWRRLTLSRLLVPSGKFQVL